MAGLVALSLLLQVSVVLQRVPQTLYVWMNVGQVVHIIAPTVLLVYSPHYHP